MDNGDDIKFSAIRADGNMGIVQAASHSLQRLHIPVLQNLGSVQSHESAVHSHQRLCCSFDPSLHGEFEML